MSEWEAKSLANDQPKKQPQRKKWKERVSASCVIILHLDVQFSSRNRLEWVTEVREKTWALSNCTEKGLFASSNVRTVFSRVYYSSDLTEQRKVSLLDVFDTNPFPRLFDPYPSKFIRSHVHDLSLTSSALYSQIYAY
jgi:hypothetical protein